MTAGQPSEVDLDLLADYLGGALADTPEESVVARLITADPDWAAAHTALTQALGSVQDSLTGWAAAAEPMPAEITDRLTAALAEASPVSQATAIPTQATDQERRLTVVPASGDRTRRDRDRTTRTARRRWSRLAGPVAVAAAVVAFAGIGVSRFGNSTSDNTTAGSSAEDGPMVTSAVPPQLASPVPERLLTTGTDYAPATLAGAVARLRQQPGGEERASTNPATPPERDQALATGVLARLADPGALAVCLEAVAAAHALGPLTVNVVDYAAFEGAPALVVAFTDRTGARWAWVSGPDCGLPTSDPDTRYRAQVG